MTVSVYNETEEKSDLSIGFDPKIERVFTTEQTCEILHLGMNSVLGLLKSQKLRSKKVGRKYLITTSAIMEFLNN